jgi:hypothetical protein
MSMFPIATIVVSGTSTNTVEFTSIPQTFTHLQVRAFWNTTATATGDYILPMTFNGDGYPNTSYSMHFMNGNGSVASAGSEINNWNATIGDLGKYGIISQTPTANNFCSVIADILDYTNTNKNKVVKSVSGYDNNSQGGINIFTSMRMSTQAITSIKLWHSGSAGFFANGCRFNLYGVLTSNATGA